MFRVGGSYCRHDTVVLVFIDEEDAIFNKDCTSSQDEGGKQVDVDVVPCTVELPVLKL